MPAPNPLPKTIPKGTKFTVGPDVYELKSIGVLTTFPSMFGSIYVYMADVSHLLTGQSLCNYNVYCHAVDWDSIEEYKESSDVDSCKEAPSEVKKCLWCSEILGSNQDSPYCAVGKVYCKEYYFALKERMELDFRTPDEALSSEKEAVVRWVKNYLGIK